MAQDREFYTRETLFGKVHSPPSTTIIPSKIGPYSIEAFFHRSRLSILYLGTHPETHTPLVIKALSPEYVDHPELIQQFLQEMQIIALTNHPHIVKLYGRGDWEGGLYIAMEFIRGISLRQFIRQRSLKLRKSLEIVLQTAYALLHLHTHGVVHRDVKPENILLQEDGEIKVIDFGIAILHTTQDNETVAAGAFIGTPSYMSPEQKKNPLTAGFAADIYSLGIIAYELVTGLPSYKPLHLTSASKDMQMILTKALDPDPAHRYQDIVDFIQDLAQYLKTIPQNPATHAAPRQELSDNTAIAQAELVVTSPPTWPPIECAVAYHPGSAVRGLYSDFFPLADHTLLITVAHPTTQGLVSLTHAAQLQGMCRALVNQTITNAQHPFPISEFFVKLHQVLRQHGDTYCFQLLLLDPLREELKYTSAGGGAILHIPAGTVHPRFLHAENPPLGHQDHADFVNIIDNWMVQDKLLLHSLYPLTVPPDMPASWLIDLVQTYLSLAVPRQADAILEAILAHARSDQRTIPQLLIEIQRIA